MQGAARELPAPGVRKSMRKPKKGERGLCVTLAGRAECPRDVPDPQSTRGAINAALVGPRFSRKPERSWAHLPWSRASPSHQGHLAQNRIFQEEADGMADFTATLRLCPKQDLWTVSQLFS